MIQSSGHSKPLHVMCWTVYGHCFPPCCASAVTARVRVFVPAPHETVQEENVPQSDAVQSIGHAWVLHSRDSDVWAQSAPPNRGVVVIERVRVCVPRPHDSVHAPKSAHWDIMQSLGHECVLHSLSLPCGHALPPTDGWLVTTTAACCEPAPHDFVQVVHGL